MKELNTRIKYQNKTTKLHFLTITRKYPEKSVIFRLDHAIVLYEHQYIEYQPEGGCAQSMKMKIS